MAITIDWDTQIINIPKADLQLVQSVPTEIRQLDINDFRLTLKDLEDNEDGIAFLTTHNHNPPVTVGGVTLARVVEIINGYSVTFEDGQYAVNLVGANSNIADVTNVNQVSVRSANSAGLTFSDAINQQSFEGHVSIDTYVGVAGTQFPRGIPTDPVDNVADALAIASKIKLGRLDVRGLITLTSAHDLSRLTITGANAKDATLIFASPNTTNLGLTNVAFTGAFNGYTTAERCIFQNVTNWEGGMFQCVMNGDLTVDPTATEDISMFDCASGIPGNTRPILDANGTTACVQVRGYNGGLTLKNFTQCEASFDIASGTLEIDSTCTGGTIVVRGNVNLIDNSGVGCTVIEAHTQTLVDAAPNIQGIKGKTDNLPDNPASEDIIVALT